METKQKVFKNKYSPHKNKEKFSKDDIQKYQYDIIDSKIKKYKSLDDNARTLLNFFMYKNKFKSHFDQKGAKQFLKEKAKALERIVLVDEIKEDKQEEFIESSKKSKSHNKNAEKYEKYKYLKQHNSHNQLANLEVHNFNSNKKQIECEENRNVNVSFASFRNMNDFNNNIDNPLKVCKQNGFIESSKNNKNKLSAKNINEPSYLMTGENDSFIYSIVKEMN